MSRKHFFLERLYLCVGPAYTDEILVESEDGTMRELDWRGLTRLVGSIRGAVEREADAEITPADEGAE